jgi:hypothetical protein
MNSRFPVIDIWYRAESRMVDRPIHSASPVWYLIGDRHRAISTLRQVPMIPLARGGVSIGDAIGN